MDGFSNRANGGTFPYFNGAQGSQAAALAWAAVPTARSASKGVNGEQGCPCWRRGLELQRPCWRNGLELQRPCWRGGLEEDSQHALAGATG